MQSSLTIENGFSASETREIHGVSVPWEVASYEEDARLADAGGGFFDLTTWGDVAITGPDARDYLNRMTTVNFKAFPTARAAYGSFLTGRAGVVTLGMFLESGSEAFHYLVAPGQSAATAEHIEKFHFGENLAVVDDSARWAHFGLWNPRPEVARNLKLEISAEPLALQSVRGEFGEALAWRDPARPSLFWVRLLRTQASAFLQSLRIQEVPLLGGHLFEYHRLKSGMPNVGEEVADKDLILEANLELAISRNKGCYPGQEVVERIFTYGQVNRKLLPVRIIATKLPSVPCVVTLPDGKKAGTLVGVQPDPLRPGEAVGLAYVQRQFWDSKETFLSEDGLTKVVLECASRIQSSSSSPR